MASSTAANSGGEGRFLARDELVPRDMAAFLRNIALVRLLVGGRDYEYRIAGDAHVTPMVRLSRGPASAISRRWHRATAGSRARPTSMSASRRSLLPARLGQPLRACFAVRLLPKCVPRAYCESVDHVQIVSAYVQRAAASCVPAQRSWEASLRDKGNLSHLAGWANRG